MKKNRDVTYITVILPKEKADYLIARGETWAINTGRLFSNSNTMGMVYEWWLKQGAPSLGPGDVPTPVPTFAVRLRYARRPSTPEKP